MTLRSAPAAATLALVLAFVGGGVAQAAPADFYGLEAKDIFGFNQAYRDAELPKVQAAGVGLMRQEFSWRAIETQPGLYSWRRYDAFVGDAAKHGIEVMPVLIGTPAFRAGPPGGEMAPPKNYADLGDFAAVVSRRYGPNGIFWLLNPTLPKVPIRRFQIWNEPNIPRFWPAGVNPAQYAAMLKAVYPRIKAADPGAEVVTAGISEPQNICCMPLREFITKMYAAGAKGSFDTLALQPYWSSAAGSITLVEAARGIMAANGDSARDVRISEIGWATGGPAYIYNQTEAGQASQLRTLYTELARRRAELHVKGIVWAIWRDHPPPDAWTQYTGLERSDGSAKPSYLAYRDVATAREPLGGEPSSSVAHGSPAPLKTLSITSPLRPSVGAPRVVRLRRLLRGLRVTLTCPTACRVDVRLTLPARASRRGSSRARVLAKAKRALPAGRARVTLVLAQQARKRLRNIRRLRVFLSAKIIPRGPGAPTTIVRKLTIRS